MTTIAFRDNIMVCDSCLCETGNDNTIYIGDVEKIYRLADGSLLGMSGDAEGQALINILNDSSIAPEKMCDALASLVGYDSHCLQVRPDGQMIWVSTGEEAAAYTPFRDRFAAIGTGKLLAYGALEMDATALEAVEAAARRHAYTRPPFISVELRYPCLTRKRKRERNGP